MSNEQKERIKKLRLLNLSYGKIAEIMGISANTVKSFCQRNNVPTGYSPLNQTSSPLHVCLQCLDEITQIPGRKKRKFCSDECRLTWWENHPEKLNKKAIYNLICANCGIKFESYGNKTRKFCSHNCYVINRFGKRKGVRK